MRQPCCDEVGDAGSSVSAAASKCTTRSKPLNSEPALVRSTNTSKSLPGETDCVAGVSATFTSARAGPAATASARAHSPAASARGGVWNDPLTRPPPWLAELDERSRETLAARDELREIDPGGRGSVPAVLAPPGETIGSGREGAVRERAHAPPVGRVDREIHVG